MYRVLLAEDEAVMRTAFMKIMDWEKSDYVLAAAVSNGAEALQYIAENPVDIVITDLKMPVMDGLELIASLKDNGFPGVILVMSNYTDFELVRAALTNGAFDYMLKLNLDGNSLRSQLDNAAKLLQDSGDTELRWQGETPFSTTIREYFLSYRKNTKAPSALTELFERQGSLMPCFFSIYPKGEKSGSKSPPVERALIVLEQIFAEMNAHIAPTSENELLMLVPCGKKTEELQRLEDKLLQAVREIQMYLNLSSTATLSPKCNSPEQARRYYSEFVRLSRDKAAGSAFQYLSDIIFHDSKKFPGYAGYKNEVRDALMFIHFHFSEKISLNDVATAVNLNSSYLCRLFKQDTGMPMFRHINELRMEKAAALIEQGSSYMREVAAAVGIDDQFFFARVFKKHYGVPPSEYAKRQEVKSS